MNMSTSLGDIIGLTKSHDPQSTGCEAHGPKPQGFMRPCENLENILIRHFK